MKLGGDEFKVSSLYMTAKAWAQYLDLFPEEQTDKLTVTRALVGTVVRRLADNSDYFIATFGPTRFVFCVAKNQPRENGNMVVVTVQEAYAKERR